MKRGEQTHSVHLLDLPQEVVALLIDNCGVIERHVLRFVNKYSHRLVHSHGKVKALDFLWDYPRRFLDIVGTEGKSVDLFIFLRENGCSWCDETFACAMSGGNVKILQYLLDENCPSEKSAVDYNIGTVATFKWFLHWFGSPEAYDGIGSNAVASESFELLEILEIRNRYKFLRAGPVMCYVAAAKGKLNVLKWLREKGCPWDSETCTAAASAKNFEILKYARENGCEWNSFTCSGAATSGSLEILKWLREQKCPWDSITTAHAQIEGNLEILRWAVENGCPMKNQVFPANLEIAKWAKQERGIDWKYFDFTWALKAKNFNVLLWAADSGHNIFDRKDVWCGAAEFGEVEILEWLYSKRPDMLMESGCVHSAAGKCHVHVFEWILEKAKKDRIPFFWEKSMLLSAAKYGQLSFVKFAIRNGCEWDAQFLEYAAENQQFPVFLWAINNGFVCKHIGKEHEAWLTANGLNFVQQNGKYFFSSDFCD